jgi:hypothetical protein
MFVAAGWRPSVLLVLHLQSALATARAAPTDNSVKSKLTVRVSAVELIAKAILRLAGSRLPSLKM